MKQNDMWGRISEEKKSDSCLSVIQYCHLTEWSHIFIVFNEVAGIESHTTERTGQHWTLHSTAAPAH